jgi:hypothetical protein
VNDSLTGAAVAVLYFQNKGPTLWLRDLNG